MFCNLDNNFFLYQQIIVVNININFKIIIKKPTKSQLYYFKRSLFKATFRINIELNYTGCV